MAYNREKIFEQAKEAVVKHELFFIADLVAYVGCSRAWFYDAFPDGSDELDTIKEFINQNKIKKKVEIRKKLFNSEKAAELLALYRLLATKEEHMRLNQSYVDHTTKGESINKPLSAEEVQKAKDSLNDDV